MNLAVVVLNWNNATDTVACVQRVFAWQELQPDVWVVDNASGDDSADVIAQQCSGVRLIRSSYNAGFGGANNLAIGAARQAGAEAVLLLNNDAAVDEQGALALGRVLLDRPTAGIVGPLIRERRGRETIYSLGGRNIAKAFDTHVTSATLPDMSPSPVAVDYVRGTVALIRGTVFDELSGFDEDYFFSGEMADFCTRAGANGWETLITTAVVADHRHGAGALRETLYGYYSIRNRFLFVRKHCPPWYLVIWAARCLRIVVRHLVRRQASIARCYWLALVDGLAGRYGDQHARVQRG